MPSLSLHGVISAFNPWRGRKEAHPARQSPALVPGGPAAPALCMKPVDGDPGTLTGSWIAQLKADGIRALHIDGRIVTMEGQPLDCALHCLPALQRLEAAYGRPMVFDGEYVEEEGFDATVAAMRKGEGAGVLWLFDAVPFDQWREDRCTEGQALRLARLRTAMPAADSPFVGMLDGWGLNGPADVRMRAEQIWDAGYEGIVLKRPDALYRRSRSSDWVRLKAVETADCPIADILMKDGRFAGLIVRGPDGPLRIASGFSDADRETFRRAAKGHGRLVAEIAYNRKAGSSKPRHARFIRLRPDKEGMN